MTFYSVPGGGHQADVVAFLTSIKDVFAAGTTILVPNSGDQINDSNGALVGTWAYGSNYSATSANTADYAAGVGCRVKWSTAGIVNGKHVRGSTFIVPISVAAYDADGTLDSAFVSTLDSLVGAFFTAMGSDLRIWSRPTTTRAGSSHQVTATQVPDKVSWLRTRRT